MGQKNPPWGKQTLLDVMNRQKIAYLEPFVIFVKQILCFEKAITHDIKSNLSDFSMDMFLSNFYSSKSYVDRFAKI